MSTDKTAEILELHKQGLNPIAIASKLELSVQEVENAVLSQSSNGPVYDAWAIETMHWGAHY